MAFILYVIVVFGMFGTVLMMTEERKYEFGVLISIGMSRIRLFGIILIILSLNPPPVIIAHPLIRFFFPQSPDIYFYQIEYF